MHTQPNQRRTHPWSFLAHMDFLAFGILGMAALWLRLRLMGYSEIWHDQARTINMALQWLHGGPFPLAGDLASLGVHNAPLVEYLYAIPLLFKEDIMGICWFIAAINLLGILIAGLATARVFGKRVAWWASLLLVVNPFAMLYSRVIWMVSFVPGFASALYACILLYFADEAKPRYLILGALCLSATIQTHLTALTLLPAFAILAIRYYKRIQIRPLLVGLALFVASFTPFILFHITTGFADIQGLRSGLENRLDVNLTAVEVVLDLFRIRTSFTPPVLDEVHAIPPLPLLRAWRADQVAVFILGAGILYAIVYSLQRQKPERPPTAGALMLWLWFCLPVFFFIPHTRLIYNYYFLYLLPVGAVLPAFAADRLYEFLRQIATRIKPPHLAQVCRAAALVVFLPLAQVAAYYAAGDIADQNLWAQNRHGLQRIVDIQRAVGNARQLLEARPECQLVVLAERPLWKDSRFGLMSELVGRERVRIVEMGSVHLYPDPCAVYFFPSPRDDIEAWLEAIARPLPDYTVPTPSETWRFYDLSPTAREAAVANLKTEHATGTWQNGLELTGLEVQNLPTQPGATSPLVFTHTWAVNAQLSPELRQQAEALRFGNHLLLDENTLVGQMDGVGLDSREWHREDVFQTIWQLPFQTPLEPGEYALGLTLYTLPEITREPLTDGSDYVFLRHFSVKAQEE